MRRQRCSRVVVVVLAAWRRGSHPGVDSEVQNAVLRGAEIEAVRGLVELPEAGDLPDHDAAVGAAVDLLDDSHLHAVPPATL